MTKGGHLSPGDEGEKWGDELCGADAGGGRDGGGALESSQEFAQRTQSLRLLVRMG